MNQLNDIEKKDETNIKNIMVLRKIDHTREIYELQKNGGTMICPFINRILVPVAETALSISKQHMQMQISQSSCNSLCPHFSTHKNVENKPDETDVYLTCGSIERYINNVTVI